MVVLYWECRVPHIGGPFWVSWCAGQFNLVRCYVQVRIITHSYKKKEKKKGDCRGEIETYTPEDQQHKTPEMLMSLVSGFMIDKIDRLLKATVKKF